MPPRHEGPRYSTRRPASPVTYEPPAAATPETPSAQPRPPRRAPSPPVFTRTPDRPPKHTTGPDAGAAPFIRPQPGALPSPPKPLELPGPPAEPRTWHMPPVAEPRSERDAGAGTTPASEETADSPQPRTDVPWEVEAMTSPDYKAPRSIHDPEHDSWPVAAPDGAAMPAWPDDATPEVELELTELADAEPEPLELTDIVGEADDETGEGALELELADVIDTEAPAAPDVIAPTADARDETGDAVAGAGEVPYLDTERDAAASFPLDAFIVPSGVEHVPAGYLEEIGSVVADRLEALARQIRAEGLASVGQSEHADELAHVLGAIVTGYLARRA